MCGRESEERARQILERVVTDVHDIKSELAYISRSHRELAGNFYALHRHLFDNGFIPKGQLTAEPVVDVVLARTLEPSANDALTSDQPHAGLARDIVAREGFCFRGVHGQQRCGMAANVRSQAIFEHQNHSRYPLESSESSSGGSYGLSASSERGPVSTANGRVAGSISSTSGSSGCASRPGVVENLDTEDSDGEYAIYPERVQDGSEQRTTLMIRNIPSKYSHMMLVTLLQTLVDITELNLVYIPVSNQNGRNKGYAFVDCAGAAAVIKLRAALHGQQWPEFNSGKVCKVVFSRLQGADGLDRLFSNLEKVSTGAHSKLFSL